MGTRQKEFEQSSFSLGQAIPLTSSLVSFRIGQNPNGFCPAQSVALQQVGLGLSLRARWYFSTNPFALGAQTAFIDCLDSIVVVSVKGALVELSAPWSLIQSNHVVVEYKMQRDHLDLQQVIQAETRRSAYHGYLLKREDSVPIGPPALWIVSGYLPEYLRTCRTVSLVSAGVHDLGQVYYQCFWIAANDLPLREELIPFLVARTGKYLEEFVRWVANKRDFQWMIHLLESIPMSSELYEEMFRKLPIPDDPEAPMRRKFIVEELLRRDPQLKEQLLEAGKKIGLEDGKKLGLEDGKKIGLEDGKKLGLEDGLRDGRVEEARKALLRVVSKRGFALNDSQTAMVAQCSDLATLEKWLDRAVLAVGVAEIFANGAE